MTHSHDLPIDPRIAHAAAEGCDEARMLISRRSMMALSAGFFGAGMIPRTALSAPRFDRRLLVVVLRGGMDGLHVLLPINDPVFQEQRKLFLSSVQNSMLPLTGFPSHRLHPKLVHFAQKFNSGKALIIQGVAPPLSMRSECPSRSHFQCQYNLETGLGEDNPISSSGWMNRLLELMPTVDRVGRPAQFTATAIDNMPMMLRGNAPVCGWWRMNPTMPFSYADRLEEYYADTSPVLHKALAGGRDTDTKITGVQDVANLPALSSTPGIRDVQLQFRGAAKLMSRSDGPRLGVISIDGWDSHINEIINTDKGLGDRLTALDMGLKDFETQMGDVWANTAVLVVTEFGRTIEINNTWETAGTEHGRATLAMLVGGNVQGQRLRGKPLLLSQEINRLDPGESVNRHDIRPTCDIRRVFKSVLIDHLGVDVRIANQVFPNTSDLAKIINMFDA